MYNATLSEKGFIANKGEHSETLFALSLLKAGHTLRYVNLNLKFHDGQLILAGASSNNIVDSLKIDIDNIIAQAFKSINSGSGTFKVSALAEVYNFLINNGINPKSPSSHKSDIIIVKKIGPLSKLTGVSVKSFLGSNPSILNANKHWTGLEYKLTNVNENDIQSIREDKFNIYKEQLSRLEFQKYSNPDFKNLVKDFTLLPEIVLKWKSGEGGKMYQLTPVSQHKAGSGFISRITQGVGRLKPTKLGVLTKKGDAQLESLSRLWELAYLDSPSRSRHDYGYFYESDGNYYIRFAIGIRSDYRAS